MEELRNGYRVMLNANEKDLEYGYQEEENFVGGQFNGYEHGGGYEKNMNGCNCGCKKPHGGNQFDKKPDCGCKHECGHKPECGCKHECGHKHECGCKPECHKKPECGCKPECHKKPECGCKPDCCARNCNNNCLLGCLCRLFR